MSTTGFKNYSLKRILRSLRKRTTGRKSSARSSDLAETLCANCSDIDLFAILKGDREGIPLERGVEVWVTRSSDPTAIWIWNEQPGCPFCEFLLAAQIHLLSPDTSKRPRYLQLDYGTGSYRDYRKFKHSTELSSHINIVFDTPDRGPEDHLFGTPDYIVSFGMTTDIKVARFLPSLLEVNEIPTWLDLNRMKQQLQECLEYHAACLQREETSSSPPSRLRVIDCFTRSIVTPPSDSPYVALSYCWGETHRTVEERQIDMLPAKLPATIEDAILVTRSLGFQYLWVDKYCILQADESDFKHQIRQMHLIYRSAQITIIAGGSMDASSGLVGVSTPRAKMQTKGRYDKLNLMTFSVWPWGSVLYTGGWNDRGWTYQESYFSQRRLIFTDEQVLFDCDRGVVSEDLQHSQIPYLSALEKWQPNSNGDRIYNLIEKYSTRVLTHDQDILNAFDGILADFDQQEPPTRSHWGVPLVIDASGYLNGLLIGLCWYQPIQNEKIFRRSGFPSWSWAGWSHNPYIDYRLRRQSDTKLAVAHGLVVHVEKHNGLVEDWKTFEEASSASTHRQHYSQRIHLSAPSIKIGLLKQVSAVMFLNHRTDGHYGCVVRSENDGYWSVDSYLDIPFENLDLSPDTYHSEEIRTCHAIYLFSADEMFDPYGDKFVYSIFSMLLVSKVGTNWERVGLWQPSFESEEEAQVFEQWLQSSPTYKTRDFWIA
jgi:hypothetical protein